MSFADIDEKKASSFQKTQFVNVIAGQPVLIRILSDKAHKVYTHYISRTTVECLGDECPICANNKRLMVESPENFRDAKGWSAQSKRYFVNVLDRTPIKICLSCQSENRKTNGKWPPTCFSCGAFLTTEPETVSNKVKVFGFGVRVAERLNNLTVNPITGDPVDILSFDFALVATGTGKEKDIDPQPMKERNDTLEVPEDALYDLEKVTIRLNPDEMLQLLHGVSLKDIFAARKESKQTDLKEDNALKELSDETKAELQKKMSDLFRE